MSVRGNSTVSKSQLFCQSDVAYLSVRVNSSVSQTQAHLSVRCGLSVSQRQLGCQSEGCNRIEIQPAYGGDGIAGVYVHSGSNHNVVQVVQARQFMAA